MENQKKMSLFDLVFMSIGGIIGAGIFSMVGTGIATTGRSVALALIVGMIFTMSQQIRYIFTASMLIPLLVEPTLTDEQRRVVISSASGMERIRAMSPALKPLCTSAE